MMGRIARVGDDTFKDRSGDLITLEANEWTGEVTMRFSTPGGDDVSYMELAPATAKDVADALYEFANQAERGDDD